MCILRATKILKRLKWIFFNMSMVFITKKEGIQLWTVFHQPNLKIILALAKVSRFQLSTKWLQKSICAGAPM
jgi:hypothetical protein